MVQTTVTSPYDPFFTKIISGRVPIYNSVDTVKVVLETDMYLPTELMRKAINSALYEIFAYYQRPTIGDADGS